MPPIFARLQEGGDIAAAEMARTFNCGIGMVAITGPAEADAVMDDLRRSGETVFIIGKVEPGTRGCTVTGSAGNWGSDEDWSVIHHG